MPCLFIIKLVQDSMVLHWYNDGTFGFLSNLREKADLALHPNAGAPSSEPFSNQKNQKKMEESEERKPERDDLCPTDSQFAASLTD